MLENTTGTCNFQDANLIHSGIKYNQLDFLESLEIKKHNNNMNLNSGVYTTCESFKYLLWFKTHLMCKNDKCPSWQG